MIEPEESERFWLGVVVMGHEKVKTEGGCIVLGKELAKGDEYIIVQWLMKCGPSDYELTAGRDCIWEIQSIIPQKKLGSYVHTGMNANEDEEF